MLTLKILSITVANSKSFYGSSEFNFRVNYDQAWSSIRSSKSRLHKMTSVVGDNCNFFITKRDNLSYLICIVTNPQATTNYHHNRKSYLKKLGKIYKTYN